MRDPSRIDNILKKIEVIWKRYPDLRFTQLVDNIACKAGGCISFEDVFYLEDSELNKSLDHILKNGF